MALLTVLSEFILMNILMAAGAVTEINSREFLECDSVFRSDFMAFNAFQRLVLSSQWIPGCSMVEFCGGFECVGVMAISTACREGLLVIIFMTAKALGLQSQEGQFLCFDRLIRNKFGFMTIFAYSFGMGSRERESCGVVIEFFFIKTKDLEVQPMMVAMAFAAFFSLYF
jgi:hypothetical protein